MNPRAFYLLLSLMYSINLTYGSDISEENNFKIKASSVNLNHIFILFQPQELELALNKREDVAWGEAEEQFKEGWLLLKQGKETNNNNCIDAALEYLKTSANNGHSLAQKVINAIKNNESQLYSTLNKSEVPKQPETLVPTLSAPSSNFEEKTKNEELRRNTLLASGFKNDRATENARFMRLTDLCELIHTNNYGSVLNLSSSSFITENLQEVFIALEHNNTVRCLLLTNCFFKPTHYQDMSHMLTHNNCLQELDLMKSSFPEENLESLGQALAQNKSLNFLNLRTKQPFSLERIKDFYNVLVSNRALRVIIWHEDEKLINLLHTLSSSNSVAALHLGVMYAEGFNVAQDLNKAKLYFQKASQLHNYLGDYELARILIKQGEFDVALAHLTLAANQDYAPAAYELCRYYRSEGEWNKLRKDPNYEEAFRWCQKAAEKKYLDALYRLGRMYEHGRGTARSDEMAIEHLIIAADLGHHDAQAALMGIYLQQAENFEKLGDIVSAELARNKADHYGLLAERFSPAAQRFKLELLKD